MKKHKTLNIKFKLKEKGFNELGINERTGEKVPFFNLGTKNDWKKMLDPKIIEKIEQLSETKESKKESKAFLGVENRIK